MFTSWERAYGCAPSLADPPSSETSSSPLPYLPGDTPPLSLTICLQRSYGRHPPPVSVASRATHLPAWLLPGVLKTWDKPCAIDHLPPEEFASALRYPARLPNALRVRWPPNPIAATIDLQGPLNTMPRLPFQIVHCLARLIRFCRRELMYNPQDRSPPLG